MSIQSVEFTDDTFTYNPKDWAAISRSLLPKPGIYKIRVLQSKWKTRADGTQIRARNASGEPYYPFIAIDRIEILEPEEDAASFYVRDSDVLTVPTQAKNRNGQPIQVGVTEDGTPKMLMTAGHIEMMRALSESDGAGEDFDSLWEPVLTMLQEGMPFMANLGYTATDKEWAQSEIERQELAKGTALDKTEKTTIWNAARYSTKSFKNGSGEYLTEFRADSGNVISANLRVGRVIPAAKQEKQVLGPYPKR